MPILNAKASPFVPSASTTPLVASSQSFGASATPLVAPASPFFPSSALSPASQAILAGELAALDRREARNARRQSEQQQQQQWGDERLAQQSVYMCHPKTFEDVQHYQQLQAQYQAQYQPYEQTWIPSQYRIEAQHPQQYHEVRGLADQGSVGNQPVQRNQNNVGTQHPTQIYAPPAQRAQPLRQFWDGGMETTIYPAPPQPSQAPQMTRKQLRQMMGRTQTNEVSMQMQADNPEEVVQVRQPDNTYERMAMVQYRASKGQQPVYVPRDASWQYQQYEQPVYVQTQAHPQSVVVQGVASQQQQQPHEQQGAGQRAISSQLPVYVHKRELGEVPGYVGYSITPERKVIRPDRVFAQVEESPIPAGGPRVRLPRAKSSPAHRRDHNGGISRFNSDLSPTRRSTDDGRDNGNRSSEGYNLSKEVQQDHRHSLRAGRGSANDSHYRQHQRVFRNSGGRNANLARRDRRPGIEYAEHEDASDFAVKFGPSLMEEEEEEEAETEVEVEVEVDRLRAMKSASRERRPNRTLYALRTVPRRRQEPLAEALSETITETVPPPSLHNLHNLHNLHEETPAVASVSSSTEVNATMTSPRRRIAPTPARRPAVEDLSFAPAATSPVRTYSFPFAPTTSSGQPLNLPVPRTNPLAHISSRVAAGEHVPGDIIDPHKLATQTVVSQMEANAMAAAAGGRGEITYLDRGKYWVERKKAGKNAWEMEGWKVGGGVPKDDEKKRKRKAGGNGTQEIEGEDRGERGENVINRGKKAAQDKDGRQDDREGED